MDIVGPVQETARYNKYILVESDYASRFLITAPMADQKARTVIAYHFVNGLILKYGSPAHVLYAHYLALNKCAHHDGWFSRKI